MAGVALFAGVAVAAGLVSALGTRALIPLLQRRNVLDRPNERSSHALPTPRGGGIAPVTAVALAWAGLAAIGGLAPPTAAVLIGTVLLAVVSWIDDLGGVAPVWRLLAQIVAVAIGVMALPQPGLVFQGWLPPALDTTAAGILWIWFVNLFNFMDGVDGLAASEAALVAAGVALFDGLGAAADPGAAALAAVIAAAALGFLAWNWSPARVFLGDVGSVPFGYLLGFLLLALAERGWWKIALILPLYFLADASITLARRLLRGERIWRAHREHFYQRAVQHGLAHDSVVRRVIAADVLLIGCGWVAESGAAIAGLAGAAIVVGLLLLSLTGLAGRGHR